MGYAQATLLPDRNCYVAYELNSGYWRQGIGGSAVSGMLNELTKHDAVDLFVEVLKARNYRSEGLLRKLGFVTAGDEQATRHRDEADEMVLIKAAALD